MLGLDDQADRSLDGDAVFPGATTCCQIIEDHFRTRLSEREGKYRKLSSTQAICYTSRGAE